MAGDVHELGVVEDTLFVPMLGRIYASERCRSILFDEKALELKERLPAGILESDTQTQYTYLASASRSANMDRHIVDFLGRKPDGIVVQLGVGLETTFYRCDDGHTKWYGVDLPAVIDYRHTLLPDHERETCFAGDAFEPAWAERVRTDHAHAPLLVTASGLFYYFEEERVMGLMRMLQGFGNVELLFDAVSKGGMALMRKRHMRTVGHDDARMLFFLDSAEELASKVGGDARVLVEERFYSQIDKSGLRLSTRASMVASDLLSMVRTVHLKL